MADTKRDAFTVDRLTTTKVLNDLVLRLFLAADRHAPTVGGILNVTPFAVRKRLRSKKIRDRASRLENERKRIYRRETVLRCWWRMRLRKIGVDPATLPPTDPLWAACYTYPRGHYVRVAAAEMRAERPGESLATPERIEALLNRVAVLRSQATQRP